MISTSWYRSLSTQNINHTLPSCISLWGRMHELKNCQRCSCWCSSDKLFLQTSWSPVWFRCVCLSLSPSTRTQVPSFCWHSSPRHQTWQPPGQQQLCAEGASDPPRCINVSVCERTARGHFFWWKMCRSVRVVQPGCRFLARTSTWLIHERAGLHLSKQEVETNP